MTKLLVTLEDDAKIALLKEAIGLFKGVKSVEILPETYTKPIFSVQGISDILEDIRSLIGNAANISDKEIEEDDRLTYNLSK